MRNGALGTVTAERASSLQPGLAVRQIRGCVQFAVHATLWLWAIDCVRVLRSASALQAGFLPLLQGLAGALFRGFAIALPPALALGCVLWLSELRRRGLAKPTLRAQLVSYVRAGSALEQQAKSGDLVAGVVLAIAWLFAGIRACEIWIVGMARPAFAAMACTASCFMLLLMAASLFPALAMLAAGACRALGRLPGIGPRCFGRVGHVAGWLGAGALTVLAIAVYRLREPLGYLPWRTLLQIVGALVGAFVSQRLVVRLPRWTRRPRAVAVIVLGIGSLVIASYASPLAVLARQISERDTFTGRLGQSALLWAWDRDRDGYLPGFGGGDCAPRDAKRNPGATDIPGNGIDEDCDGGDLDPKRTAARGKYDFPVPAGVPERPPIVLITVDAFAARHMHALGYARSLTPQIDALAARSVFFRQCYAQGPSTRLSFPSLFASRWDTQIEQELVGHHPFPIAPSEVLLAEVLQQAGYDTSAILSDHYFSPRFWRGITRGFSRLVEEPFEAAPKLPHDGVRVTDAALAELKRPHEKPLFLWVHYYDAHSPHQQPPDVPVFGTSRQDIYDAELNLVDREVGRLLAAINAETSGHAVVVLTADHGIAFDEPRHADFNYGYDLHTSVLHVPLIVAAPFLTPRALDGVVSTMDIAPTLANLLRLERRLPYEGMSLVPELFQGETRRPPELMHQMFIEERKWKHEEPLERVSLRTDRFNLLQDRKTGMYELYDYRTDYYETNNLALDPLYGPTLARLRRELTSLLYSASGLGAQP